MDCVCAEQAERVLAACGREEKANRDARDMWRQRAEAAERERDDLKAEIREAIALLNPARPGDGLLPAIRDLMQVVELSRNEDIKW